MKTGRKPRSKRDPQEFFTEHWGLKVKKLGELVKAVGSVRVGADRLLYRYQNGVYLPDGEDFARDQVRRILDYRWRQYHERQVLGYLRTYPASIGCEPIVNRINVANGLLDWKSGRQWPHLPRWAFVNQIPAAWNPEATCPAVEAFLHEVLPDGAIDFIWEVIGYALYAGNPLRKAVLLLGPGKNGKSVLLNLITELLGADNVSTVPLQVLSENRFAASEVFGKLANICGDLDARAIKNTDIFKMVTGGDRILAERKYRDHFSFTPYALPIFAANEAPFSADQSEGWFDRWIVIPMEFRVPEAQKDPHLTKKLTTPDELEGVLAKAIPALRRLMKRGEFKLPESVLRANRSYREYLDTIRAFLDEECDFKPDEWIQRSQLYLGYRDWCSINGLKSITRQGFNERLRRGPPQLMERRRNGIDGWLGIQRRGKAAA